ncbi:MAG: hypothetical protein KBS81_08920, partial [Spirochaetales bacterium]|nr:hypothetical protein [Candidatus Physcosoma equi]
MRHFLLANGALVIWFITIVEIMIMTSSLKHGKETKAKLLAAICFGLVVDAFIQGIGIFVGEGA